MVKFFNEMYEDGDNPGGAPAPTIAISKPGSSVRRLSAARERAEADPSFRRVGITFAVYGDDAELLHVRVTAGNDKGPRSHAAL
jgi:hypothetical protein